MAVWPYLMAVSGVAVGAAFASRDRAKIITTCAILGGYVAGRWVRETLPSEDVQIVAFGVIWMAVAGLDAKQRQVDTKTVLLAAVASCYFVARVIDAPRVAGSWPFVLSDILALVTMTWFIGESVRDVVAGRSDLGYTDRRGLSDSRCGDKAGRG